MLSEVIAPFLLEDCVTNIQIDLMQRLGNTTNKTDKTKNGRRINANYTCLHLNLDIFRDKLEGVRGYVAAPFRAVGS